jgi:hypothetical protein
VHNQVTEIARQVISDEPVISIRLLRDADTRREVCIAFVWPPQPVLIAIKHGESRSSAVSHEHCPPPGWASLRAQTATFQAGQASSILVTRSKARPSPAVRSCGASSATSTVPLTSSTLTAQTFAGDGGRLTNIEASEGSAYPIWHSRLPMFAPSVDDHARGAQHRLRPVRGARPPRDPWDSQVNMG